MSVPDMEYQKALDAIKTVKREIERLQTIVATHPMTRDGMVVTWESRLWISLSDENDNMWRGWAIVIDIISQDNDEIPWLLNVKCDDGVEFRVPLSECASSDGYSYM